MNGVMQIGVAFALLLLCLSMKRHQRDVIGRTLQPSLSRSCRRTGILLLLLSAVHACIGGAMAIFALLGSASLTIVAIALLLPVCGVLRKR
ncbi:DUF3325 family protein [Novosphingobium sp.]|uniref:DUF3325 family protein n=2 Tax=Sphingomonadales TaxID=204457 RepID=UPI0015953A23|nr:DUF3325 family protein [Sphingomonas sp. CDS-1]MBA4757609.1 DUF3325 domain-containing protein [Sphingosinicella sp.]